MNYKHLNIINHEDPPVFEVIFADNSRSAVDEYVEAVLQFAESLRGTEAMNRPIWLLIDVTQSGIYSLQYSRTKIGELVKQINDIPKAYFAYLVEDAQDRYVIENFSMTGNPRQKDTRQVFTGAERDKAIMWLIEQTEL